MKDMIYIKEVVTLQLDKEKCNGCMMCISVCPHEVFDFSDKKVYIKNLDYCMECGACAKNCRTGAITVKSGVGCAAGIINGIIRGTEPTCDCSNNSTSCC
jgi:NAD-dependent dihydropyrimidine dehydrogenase PreA subunit